MAETTYHGAYQPLQGTTMSEAYRSTVELSYDVRAGLVMRQAHHWAAIVFIAAIVVHLLRVFFTGAFRRPREINWIVGVTLLILAFFNGFTGYSLPDDLLSGHGTAHRVLDRPIRTGDRNLDGLPHLRGRVPGRGDHPPAVRDPHPDRARRHRRL